MKFGQSEPTIIFCGWPPKFGICMFLDLCIVVVIDSVCYVVFLQLPSCSYKLTSSHNSVFIVDCCVRWMLLFTHMKKEKSL